MLNAFNNKKPTQPTFSIIYKAALIFSCLCLYATKSFAQENKASYILEAMSYQLKAIPSYAMHINTETNYLERNELLGRKFIYSNELAIIDLYRDGSKFDSRIENIRYPNGKAEQKIISRRIWNGKRYCMRQSLAPERTPSVMISDKEKISASREHLSIYGDFLDGFIVGNQNIVKIISDSNDVKLRNRLETISGKKCETLIRFSIILQVIFVVFLTTAKQSRGYG